jgi:hypothetical protein
VILRVLRLRIRPDAITPEPGSFHNADRSLYSVFWPLTTPDQIEAFVKYVKFVVTHFRSRIQYYALWNEQDITYWNPIGNPEEYGRLLKAFVPAVHETDPQVKVIYGGLADPSSDFARRSLDACQCGAGIDVFAYHTYPGYGQNLNPESMDYGAYGPDSPGKLRETVRNYPGIRKDIPFWDDEFNSIPSWEGSDESVQAKYVSRGLVYNWAAGVRTFVWLLAAGTDGNEYDDFGIIHGLRNQPDDFTPRPVKDAAAALLNGASSGISVFNSSCFADPGDQQAGNAPRYFEDLNSQGIVNVDLGLRKQFNIRENMRFQVRMEAFNALNRTRFDRAGLSWGGGSFGQVSSLANGFKPRQMQIGAGKRLYWKVPPCSNIAYD